MSELTDAELSAAVALACGLNPREMEFFVGGDDDNPNSIGNRWVCDPIEGWETLRGWAPLPRFATSLDACFGPGGPVEYAKSKDWYVDLVWNSGDDWNAQFVAETGVGDAFDPNPARALCIAFLAAVKAMS